MQKDDKLPLDLTLKITGRGYDLITHVQKLPGEAGENEQGRVGIVAHFGGVVGFYYVSRTTHDVVIA